jgi:2-oxo-4-hydroxy-4-carboxy-5-ureidoimidazoline decarboxylase
LAEGRPYASNEALLRSASEIWRGLKADDWTEAFRSHPRIGERLAERATTATSAGWSAAEQSAVQQADAEMHRAIVEGNRRYEERFGRIFIICASGQPPTTILETLDRRLGNDDETEMIESATQQEKILKLRLRKWLAKAVDV